MTNELQNEKELIKFDNAKYPINYVRAKIDFDGAEKLGNDIDKILENFQNITVPADYVAQAKKEHANLMKLANSLHETKQQVVQFVGQDIIDFENQITLYEKKIKETAKGIKVQTDKYNEQMKRDKHAMNLKKIGELLEENNLPRDAYLERINNNDYNPKWDNKTYSYVAFQNEVADIIKKIKEEEKLRAENIKVIIQACDNAKSSLDSKHWIEELDSGKPLSKVIQAISEYDKQVQDAVNHNWDNSITEQTPQTATQQEKNNLEERNGKVINAETGEVVDELVTVKLELKVTKAQLKQFSKALKKFAIDNNIPFKNIKLTK